MYRIFFKIQQNHWWFVTKREIILDTIKNYTSNSINRQILDIGCGSGLMLNSLEKIGQTSGMDMSDEAISFSKEIFKGTVEKGNLPDHVPYPKNNFNLITALDVIEHIDQDVESLQTIRSLLIHGGKAIITVPAYMFLWSSFDEINEHKRRYTLSELRSKLLQAGFIIEKISYYNTLLFPAVYLVRMLNNVMKKDGSNDMDMPTAPINAILKSIFGIEKYLLKYLRLPFGVSVLAVVKR